MANRRSSHDQGNHQDAEYTEFLVPFDRRRGGVTSDRKILANRANARASSGPKTADGKTQSAQNAFRHGFNVPVRRDTDLASDVDALAQRIVGEAPTSISWSRRDGSPRRRSICAASAPIAIG